MEADHTEDIGTFTTITGATVAEARRTLEAYEWDLNAAVNHFMEHGPLPAVDQPARDIPLNPDPYSAGILQPGAGATRLGQIGDSDPGFGAAPDATLGRSVPSLTHGRQIAPSWEEDETDSARDFLGRGGNVPVTRVVPGSGFRSGFGGSAGGGVGGAFGRGVSAPRVSHPVEVRDVPIEWKDDEDRPPRYDGGRFGPLAPQIEELPADAQVDESARGRGPMYFEEKDDEDEDEKDEDDDREDLMEHRVAGSTRAGGTAVSGLQGPLRGPAVREPFGTAEGEGGGLGRGLGFSGPLDARMGGDGMEGRDDSYIEEEMLKAAIAASREEEERYRRTGGDEDLAGGSGPAAEGADHMEDDDVARAMALSLKTAEEEKARRHLAGPVDVEGAEVDMDLDTDRVDPPRGPPAGNPPDAATGGMPHVSFAEEEEESEEVLPLLRRRSLRRAQGQTSAQGIWGPGGEGQEGGEHRAMGPPSGRADSSGNEPRGEQGGRSLAVDELAGLSPEEQEEAKMIEAAMFGVPYMPPANAVPVGAPPAHYPMPPGHYMAGGLGAGRRGGYPFPGGLGGMNADFEDEDEEDEGGLRDRRSPQPPSEELVRQRLLREQQDDEYAASLAADREKEVRALEEKEAAGRAAREEEERRLQEERGRQMAAEAMERQLAAKRASLPQEPSSEESAALTLQVRMPDGTRRSRRFLKTDPLQALFDFIDVGGGVTPGNYRLVQMYPRRPYSASSEEAQRSFQDLGLVSKQEALMLEPM